MEIKGVCGYILKDDGCKVLEFLEGCENRPSMEEIMDATGLSKHKVRRALSSIKSNMRMYRSRQKLKDFLDE